MLFNQSQFSILKRCEIRIQTQHLSCAFSVWDFSKCHIKLIGFHSWIKKSSKKFPLSKNIFLIVISPTFSTRSFTLRIDTRLPMVGILLACQLLVTLNLQFKLLWPNFLHETYLKGL